MVDYVKLIKKIKLLLVIIFSVLISIQMCFSQAQKFDPVDYTQNATFQANFLSAIGETPDFCIDFEAANLRNTPVGPAYKNLHNVAGLFPNGVKFTETDNNLWVAQGKGMTWEDVNADNDNDLGEGPVNTGQWALSNSELASTTIDFGTNPVDYVSFYFGDWDLAGKPENQMDCTITLTFADNTTLVIPTDRTASSKYEFWGYYVGPGGKKIKSVKLECYDNTSQWGLDDVCYGTVVCSASIVANSTQCNNNGTSADATDDWFTLNVTGTITNGSGNYRIKIGAYTSPSTPSGTALNIIGNGLAGNPLLKADGVTTYSVRIEDAIDSTCYVEFTTTPVNHCSGCPNPNCATVTKQINK